MPKLKILYVTSLPHSGSTLLDQMLNAHSQLFSVGEIKQLSRKWRNLGRDFSTKRSPYHCSCGQEFALCNFWSEVDRRVKSLTDKSIAEFDFKGFGDEAEFVADNSIAFKVISEVAEKKIIVDSSKDILRLSRLLKVPEILVVPIFLIRNPKGQINSLKAKAARKKPNGQHYHLLRAIGQYNRTHRAIQATIATMPHLSVRYEQLVAQPEAVLSSIMSSLDLSFEPQQLQWTNHPRHLVAGNHMRWQTESVIKFDQRWQSQLNPIEKFLIDLGTSMVSRHAFL